MSWLSPSVLGLVYSRRTPTRVRSHDVPLKGRVHSWSPCTTKGTPTWFKQHRVTTTRPRNCYAKVSPRLGRSRHRFSFSPFETWTAVHDQESVNARRKDDGTIIVFSFSPFKTWTVVHNQESANARRKDNGTIIVFSFSPFKTWIVVHDQETASAR
ncbi:hypothetical protein TNCV_1856691 [Trichonephila clavipes]|nr:hypothetical protein TNCV_1856691 [Trichonephila clavipes]